MESVSPDSWLSSLLCSSFPWLSSCWSGPWALVQRRSADLFVKGEPHVVQQLAIALEADENNAFQFYCRILGRTISSGQVRDVQELSELLHSFFGQTRVCVGFFGKMESRGHVENCVEWPFARICGKQCLLTAPKESEQDALIFLCQSCADAVTQAANFHHKDKKRRKKSRKFEEEYWDDDHFEEDEIREPIGDFITAEVPPEVLDYNEQEHYADQLEHYDDQVDFEKAKENSQKKRDDNDYDGLGEGRAEALDWSGPDIKEERPSSCSPTPEPSSELPSNEVSLSKEHLLKESKPRKKPTPKDPSSSTFIHRRKGTYTCDLCGEYGLCSPTAVMAHKRRVHMYNRFTCPRRKICSYTAHFAVDIERHVRQHHPDVTELLCVICKEKIGVETYSVHYKECHEKREAKNKRRGRGHFQCDLCGQVLSTAKALENHVLVVHEKVKSYKCDECDYVVAYKQQLHLHKLKHHPKEGQEEIEKKHMCDLCGKYFQYRYYLEYHVKTVHMKMVKEFKCHICGIVTHGKGSLNKHIALKHSTNPESECPQCGKRFGTIMHLKVHMRSHEPPKFACETCGKLLKSEATLRDHMRLHTGDKPFKCDLCTYSCHSSSTLSLHKKFKHRKVGKMGNNCATDVKEQQQGRNELVMDPVENSAAS